MLLQGVRRTLATGGQGHCCYRGSDELWLQAARVIAATGGQTNSDYRRPDYKNISLQTWSCMYSTCHPWSHVDPRQFLGMNNERTRMNSLKSEWIFSYFGRGIETIYQQLYPVRYAVYVVWPDHVWPPPPPPARDILTSTATRIVR